MIAHAEFLAALCLGAVIGGCGWDALRALRRRWLGSPRYRIEIFSGPPPANPVATYERETLAEALIVWDQHKGWETTRQMFLIPPDGLPVSWTNLRHLN